MARLFIRSERVARQRLRPPLFRNTMTKPCTSFGFSPHSHHRSTDRRSWRKKEELGTGASFTKLYSKRFGNILANRCQQKVRSGCINYIYLEYAFCTWVVPLLMQTLLQEIDLPLSSKTLNKTYFAHIPAVFTCIRPYQPRLCLTFASQVVRPYEVQS